MGAGGEVDASEERGRNQAAAAKAAEEERQRRMSSSDLMSPSVDAEAAAERRRNREAAAAAAEAERARRMGDEAAADETPAHTPARRASRAAAVAAAEAERMRRMGDEEAADETPAHTPARRASRVLAAGAMEEAREEQLREAAARQGCALSLSPSINTRRSHDPALDPKLAARLQAQRDKADTAGINIETNTKVEAAFQTPTRPEEGGAGSPPLSPSQRSVCTQTPPQHDAAALPADAAAADPLGEESTGAALSAVAAFRRLQDAETMAQSPSVSLGSPSRRVSSIEVIEILARRGEVRTRFKPGT